VGRPSISSVRSRCQLRDGGLELPTMSFTTLEIIPDRPPDLPTIARLRFLVEPQMRYFNRITGHWVMENIHYQPPVLSLRYHIQNVLSSFRFPSRPHSLNRRTFIVRQRASTSLTLLRRREASLWPRFDKCVATSVVSSPSWLFYLFTKRGLSPVCWRVCLHFFFGLRIGAMYVIALVGLMNLG
jgi:hypothetical protein